MLTPNEEGRVEVPLAFDLSDSQIASLKKRVFNASVEYAAKKLGEKLFKAVEKDILTQLADEKCKRTLFQAIMNKVKEKIPEITRTVTEELIYRIERDCSGEY